MPELEKLDLPVRRAYSAEAAAKAGSPGEGGKEYADVRPSGNRMGDPISLDDVLPHLKSFKLRQPYVYLVGGLPVHGKTEGDIDILIKDSETLPREFRHILEWRITRSLPEKLWNRVQFHYDHFHGPFTDNVPLFDLAVERVNEENQVFRMQVKAGGLDLVKELPREEILEKSNYLGSKRRLARYIVGKFPEDAKTVADPMCGVSGVLIEAARRGCRVRGNDLSVVPYWYSKGVFEGAPLSDEDMDKLVAAPPHDGWLTTEWKGVYPRPRALRRYLDGLAKLAREWKGPKGWAAKAAVSAVLQTTYSESGSGYSTRRYESLDKVRGAVRRAAREVSNLAAEVGGRGTITNEDARYVSFPKADVVYFDPPYFKRDKGVVQYFQTYRVMNSILLGREWKEENILPEDIPPILEKLCRSCRHIFLSTSSNEVVPYAKELARHKRTTKRYRVSYTQTSGFGSRDAEQHQNLYVAKVAGMEKQADPYMRLPDEAKSLSYVVQAHHRGRSVHDDFRVELAPGGELIGWTLNTQIAGSIKEPVTTLAEARALEFEDYSKINWETGEFVQRRKEGSEELVNASIVAERKSVEPAAWLSIEGAVRAGAVGATRTHPGVFRIVDKGTVEFLSQKPWFHEYLPHSDREKRGFDYRVFLRQLRVADIKREEEEKALSPALLEDYLAHDPDVLREDWDEGYWEFLKARGEVVLPAAETKFREEAAWLLIKPIDQTPYVLSDRAVEDGWLPPKGFSALPKAVRSKVPTQYRYWQMERESERREMRDALVEAVDAGDVALPAFSKAPAGKPGIEKAEHVQADEVESSARFVLQYHYFHKRGEKPVRAGPTTWHWDLRIDAGEKTLRHWILDHDVTQAPETVGYFEHGEDKRALEAEGFFPPGTYMNPTKDTPSFVEIVDKGECRILVDQPALLKVEFEGQKLKGAWLLEKKNSNWHVRRLPAAPVVAAQAGTQAAPNTEKMEALACSP